MIHFIMLGTRRTGSTVISNALADHPQILQYGELFHDRASMRAAEAAHETMGAGVLRHLPNGLPTCLDADDGHDYLSRLFSQSTPAQAIGFKIFYHHARRGPIASVWDYLDRHTEIRILHIQRRNWLESLISEERAKLTKIWHATNSVTTQPFGIAPARCQEYFGELKRWRAVIQPLLVNHPVLGLEYQQFTEDFSRTLTRICCFLEVNSEATMVPRLTKIAQQEPRAELVNYQELQTHFRNTPYADFFP